MKGYNVGNIRRSPYFVWVGEVRPMPYVDGFATFENIIYAYRAMIKILANYSKTGAGTLAQMIARYAPPFENTTASYINYISIKTGISPGATVTASQLPQIVYWMGNFEQGYQPGTVNDALQAYAMIDNVANTNANTAAAGWMVAAFAALAIIGTIRHKKRAPN